MWTIKENPNVQFQQFVFVSFLFQHDSVLVHKPSSTKIWFHWFGVELELDWSTQSPDFNPIQHLWDGLEHQL